MEFVVAVDGPAGVGKGTIAKLVADELNFVYLDTGAMYRAITLKVLKNNISEKDIDKVKIVLEESKIDIKNNNFYLDGENVENEIRGREVSKNVSKFAAIKEVREKLVFMQREIAKGKKAVLEGRDIGTVVFPDASLKIYLNATAEARASRRLKDYEAKGIKANFEEVLGEIIKRDTMDMTRKISPLKKADDAIEVDTSNLSIEEVFNIVKELIENKL